MGSKLLKVCAAVMLIVSAGSAMGNDASERFTPTSFEATLNADVKAVVVCEYEQGQSISLVKQNGSLEDEEKRKVCFKITNVASGFALVLEAGNGLLVEGQQANLTAADGEKLPIQFSLQNGESKNIDFSWGETVPFDEKAHRDGEWCIKASVDLKNNTKVGNYSGKIKISIVAMD